LLLLPLLPSVPLPCAPRVHVAAASISAGQADKQVSMWKSVDIESVLKNNDAQAKFHTFSR